MMPTISSRFRSWIRPVRIISPALALTLAVPSLSGCQWWHPPKNNNPALSEASNPSQAQDIVTIFFSRAVQGSQAQLADVVRSLPDNEQEPLRFALDELLKGPRPDEKNQGFYSEIPAGTKLLALQQKDNTVTVNLSRQFISGGGSTSMTQRVEELKRTVYAVDHKHQLSVAVEGKPLEILGGEGLEVPEVVKREAR